jgi:flagella basal body P-ring formation protein FlgA
MKRDIEERHMTTGSRLAWKQACGMGLALVFLCLSSSVVHAATQQDPAAVQAQAEHFLKRQTRGLPGKVSIQVEPPRSALPACSVLDAFQPVGSRSIGKVAIGVRCLAPTTWTVYLSAQVRVIGSYALPADVVTRIDDLQGYRTVSGLAAGAPLRTALLRPPLAVQQGQVTRVVVHGPGFSVESEGQALANASRGDRVRIKTRSGQVISGIAEDGQQVVVAF